MIYAKTGPCKGQIFPLCAPPQQLYNKHMAHRNQVGHYGATHWGKSERNSCRMRTSHMMRFSSIQNAEKTELFSQGLFYQLSQATLLEFVQKRFEFFGSDHLPKSISVEEECISSKANHHGLIFDLKV